MKRYFVIEVVMPARATTMEKMLADNAEKNFLHAVIHEDRFVDVLRTLENVQKHARAANKRIREVEIKLEDEYDYTPGYRVITVGTGCIRMQQVRREIQFFDRDCPMFVKKEMEGEE